MEAQTAPALSWQEVTAVLRRRRRLITLMFVGGLTAAVVAAFSPAPVYEATARLQVTSERARMIVSPDPKSGSAVDRVNEQDLNSEVALLKSDGLIRAVLEPYRSRLVEHNGWLDRLTYPIEYLSTAYLRLHGVPPPTPFDRWVQSVGSHLRITPIKGSEIIEVGYEDGDPTWTAELVNALTATHVTRTARLNQQPDARRFFETQRQLLSERLRHAEQALQSFSNREGIDSFGDQRTALRAQLVEVESSLAHSKTELAEAAARAAFLTGTLRTRPATAVVAPATSQSNPLQVIRTRVVELELQRSALLAKFAPTSMKVQELDQQIDEAKRLLVDETKVATRGGTVPSRTYEVLELNLAQTQAQAAAVKARLETLQVHLSDGREKLERLDGLAAEHERLQQEVSAAREAFDTYRKKEEEARFSEALDESRIVNVAVVEPAEVPTAPQTSKRMTVVLLGAAMSLLIGVGIAFISDRADPTIKGSEEAVAISGLPLLADLAA